MQVIQFQGITTTHGAKSFLGLASLQRLQAPQWCHSAWQVPSTSHTRFLHSPHWYECILQGWLCSLLPPDTRDRWGYFQNHRFWAVWVSQNWILVWGMLPKLSSAWWTLAVTIWTSPLPTLTTSWWLARIKNIFACCSSYFKSMAWSSTSPRTSLLVTPLTSLVIASPMPVSCHYPTKGMPSHDSSNQ